MPQNGDIRALLEDLRGGGFNASLLINGVELGDQKVISFSNGLVYTVDKEGVARATRIERIDSVDF